MNIYSTLKVAMVGMIIGNICVASEQVIIQCRTKKDSVRIAQDGDSFVLYLKQDKKSATRSLGKLEYLGSAGNRRYTFSNGEMTYRISDDRVCSTDPFYFNSKSKVCRLIIDKISAGKEPVQEECRPSIRRPPVQ